MGDFAKSKRRGVCRKRKVNIDEKPPELSQRLPEAIDLARKISRYGGAFILLIHPNVVGEKLEFERKFISAVKEFAWFGSIQDFGDWWSARDQVGIDISGSGDDRLVSLSVPVRMSGLALHIPSRFRFVSSEPSGLRVSVKESLLVIQQAQGNISLRFRAEKVK